MTLKRSVDTTRPEFLSEAALDLLAHEPVIECLMASRIVKIMCLKALLGEKFDACVAYFIRENDPYAPDILGRLTDRFILPTDEHVGFTHIINVEAYSILDPDGAARGHNVYQTKEGNYVGFDSALFGKGPVTGNAIEKSFYQAFMDIPSVTNGDHSLKDEQNFLRARRDRQKNLQVQGALKWYQFDTGRINAFLEKQELPNKWW